MNFAFSPEQEALRETARRLLDEHAPVRRVREVMESQPAFDRGLWERMARSGWQATAIPEAYGGAGFGYLELAVIAEELGRSLAPTPFSSSIYLAAEAILRAGSEEQRRTWLPRLASGEVVGAFALTEASGWIDPAGLQARVEGGRLWGTKLPVTDGQLAQVVVAVARTAPDAVGLVLVETAAAGTQRRSLPALDLTRPQAELRFEDAPCEPLARSGWEVVEGVLDRAVVLFAFEQLGGAQRCLEMATAYAKDRYQFGRPIGSFQAIKHRLADMFVAVESARSNCYYGAWAAAGDHPELPVAACLARISATEAYDFASLENIQVHGGVGFTWEADPHLYLRRAKTLELLFGPPAWWRELLMRRLGYQAKAS